jgi:hypothetical protein
VETSIQNAVAGSAVTKPEKKRVKIDMADPVLLRKFYRVHTSMLYQDLSKTLKKEILHSSRFLYFYDFYSKRSVFEKFLGKSGSNPHLTQVGYNNNCNGKISKNALIWGSDLW